MRIALAQINPTLADFENNSQKIIDQIKVLSAKKAELIIFPEASLFGYHPFDLLERTELVEIQLRYLKVILKKIPKNIFVLIGGFEPNKNKTGRPYFNSAFLCTKDKILKSFHKELLPTGDVFDEGRFIEPGDVSQNFFKIKGKTFFVTICEDIWAWPNQSSKTKKQSEHSKNPLLKIKNIQRKTQSKKIDLIINMSASPFYLNKISEREYFAYQTARYFKAPLVYVNLVGAQDEIIFDGQSFLITEKNKIIFKLQDFNEDSNVFDLNTLESWAPHPDPVLRKTKTTASEKNKGIIEQQLEQLRKALVMGIKDYTQKSQVQKVHLGLSGGIDSALVAALAVDALGASQVKCFALPTQFNAEESLVFAKQLADNLGIQLQTISIQSTFELIKNIIDQEFEIKKFDLTHENIQSRIRGLFLMAYSNFSGSLLLTTGNKSEYATGYATLYGDMCGGLAPIADLTKNQIVDLCRHYNKEIEIIPEFIIQRPPSAELKPDQKDQDSLPPYNVLDKAVENIVQKKFGVKSKTEKWLLDRLYKTEFKRWQSAPILKVSEHAFGRGRRMPLAHKAKA